MLLVNLAAVFLFVCLFIIIIIILLLFELMQSSFEYVINTSSFEITYDVFTAFVGTSIDISN